MPIPSSLGGAHLRGTRQREGDDLSGIETADFGGDDLSSIETADFGGGQATTASYLDKPLHEAAPGHLSAERIFTGDFIRDIPKTFGPSGTAWTGGQKQEGVGSQQQRDLALTARTSGMPLAAQPAETTAGKMIAGGTQFAANVLAGVAGTLAAMPALVYTGGSNLMREVAEGTARMVLPHWLPKDLVEKPWFKEALESGELSWDAHGRRLKLRSKEFTKSFVMGLNPAVTALIMAKEGERADRFWEAMYTYPVESLLPVWHFGTRPLMKTSLPVVGKAKPVIESVNLKAAGIEKANLDRLIAERRGKKHETLPDLPSEASDGSVSFRVRTMRGKELKLNDAGRYAWDRTADWMKPFLWDAEPSAKALPRLLHDYAVESVDFQKVHEASVESTMKSLSEGIRENIESWEEAYLQEHGEPAQARDIIKAVEMAERDWSDATGKSKRLSGLSTTVERIASSKGLQESWGNVYRGLVDGGLGDVDAALVASVALRTTIELTRTGRGRKIPGTLKEGGEFLSSLPDDIKSRSGAIEAALSEFAAKIEGEPAIVDALAAEAYRLKTSRPEWTVFMENQRAAAKGTLDYSPARWVPKHALVTRVGEARLKDFTDTMSRAREMMTETLAEEGETMPYFPVTEHGALMETSLFSDWKRHAERAVSEDGKARLLAVMALDPVLRINASKKAGPFAKRVAEVMSNPMNGLHKYRRFVQKLSYEASKNLGLDPVLLARNYDSYLSRMLKEAANSEASIFQDLVGGYVGKYLTGRGSRIARRLSKRRSDQWMSDLTQRGVIDIERVLMNTVTQTAHLADLMKYYSDLKDSFVKSGLAVEPVDGAKPKVSPGWEQIAVTKEKGGAGGNPYNFVLGKLAGLYVHPTVAKRLRLTRRAMKSASGLLTTWKLMHTIYNPPGYPIRNHIGDFVNIIAATGKNPWMPGNSKHRKMWRDSEQESALRLIEPDTPMTKEWLEMMHMGVVGDVVHVADVSGASSAFVGKATSLSRRLASMMVLGDADAKSLVESVQLPPLRLMQLQSLGRITKRLSPKGMWGQFKKLKNSLLELRSEWQKTKGLELGLEDKAVYSWLLGSEKLNEFNTWLGNNALAQWNIAKENGRRAYLYRHAKKNMGMKPGEAANFVKTVLHDYGDKPAWLERAQKSDVRQFLLPPFLTYGYKQALYGTKRVLNDPHLPVAAALVKGMVAWNMQANHEEEQNNRNYMAMIRLSGNTRWGNDRWLLGSNKKFAESAQALGAGKHLVDAIGQGKLAMTLPLRDLFNLNTMLTDIRPSADPMEQLARSAPFFDMAYASTSSHGESIAQRTIGNPASTEGHHVLQRKLTFLAMNFIPHHMWRQLSTSAKAIHTAATGEKHRTKSGTLISPAEALRPLLPATPISPIDQANVVMRIEMALKGELSELSQDFGRHKNSFNIFDKDERILRSRAEIEYEFKRAEVELVAARRISGPRLVPNSRFLRLRKIKKKALQRFDEGHDISTATLLAGEAGATVRAFQRALASVMPGD